MYVLPSFPLPLQFDLDRSSSSLACSFLSPDLSYTSQPEVPVVKDTVIARCRRCRSYINPYVTFIEGGNRWKCPMCNLANDVPQLFDWNQETNQPADRWQRPELNCSVVEFVAPTEYMVSTRLFLPSIFQRERIICDLTS
jgi:hypothetical protein